MSRFVPRLLYAALFLAVILHNDFWLWNDAAQVAGLPVGLAYHIAFCLVVTLVLALVVRFAWPDDLGDH